MRNKEKLIDMTGHIFGDWTVISRVGNALGGKTTWLAKCACGTVRTVIGYDLRKGKSTNCGCVNTAKLGSLRRTHGGTRTRLHNIWTLMKRRCRNPQDKAYPSYGGRGISLCEEWSIFEPFRDWSEANGYSPDLTIDRINNNGGYHPDNCRWATKGAQSQNRRNVHMTDDGRVAIEVARENGITVGAYKGRLRAGWPAHLAATRPMRHYS